MYPLPYLDANSISCLLFYWSVNWFYLAQIPSPNVVDDHQTNNAYIMADVAGSKVITEDELDSQSLEIAIDEVLGMEFPCWLLLQDLLSRFYVKELGNWDCPHFLAPAGFGLTNSHLNQLLLHQCMSIWLKICASCS